MVEGGEVEGGGGVLEMVQLLHQLNHLAAVIMTQNWPQL